MITEHSTYQGTRTATLPKTTKRGSNASPVKQLYHRDHGRRRQRGEDRGEERGAPGTGLLGQAERVRGQAEQSDEGERPGEAEGSRPDVAGRDRVGLAQAHDRDDRADVQDQAPGAAHSVFIGPGAARMRRKACSAGQPVGADAQGDVGAKEGNVLDAPEDVAVEAAGSGVLPDTT